jgi:hypothetical protein
MPELSTPEAPPENEQDNNLGKNRLPKGPDANQQKPKSADKAPWYAPEAKGGDGAMTEISEAQRRKYMEGLNREQPKSAHSGETPWQHARGWTRQPLKTGTKIGLFALNPVVYSSVYAADWLAQRTPGVKNLYSTPREIIRSTADKSMNVLNGAATFVPALPFNVAHEVSDKLSGMDVSKPTTLVGKLTDKLGDVIGGGLKLSATAVSKIAELVKTVGKPSLELAGTAIAAPFKAVFGTIGAAYSGLSKIGGITGLIGQLALTGVLLGGGHAAIGASLAAISPAAHAIYAGSVDTILSSVWPF